MACEQRQSTSESPWLHSSSIGGSGLARLAAVTRRRQQLPQRIAASHRVLALDRDPVVDHLVRLTLHPRRHPQHLGLALAQAQPRRG